MQMKRVAGKPRQGRGLRKRLGAFWKWLECDARVPLQGCGGSVRACLGSFPLPPSLCPVLSGRNRQTTKTGPGDLPPCFAISVPLLQRKQRWRKAALRAAARAAAAPTFVS